MSDWRKMASKIESQIILDRINRKAAPLKTKIKRVVWEPICRYVRREWPFETAFDQWMEVVDEIMTKTPNWVLIVCLPLIMVALLILAELYFLKLAEDALFWDEDWIQ